MIPGNYLHLPFKMSHLSKEMSSTFSSMCHVLFSRPILDSSLVEWNAVEWNGMEWNEQNN